MKISNTERLRRLMRWNRGGLKAEPDNRDIAHPAGSGLADGVTHSAADPDESGTYEALEMTEPENYIPPGIEDNQIMKRHIWRGGRPRQTLMRILRRLKPEPTPEDIAEREEQKRREQLRSLLRTEADQAIESITNVLDRRGLCYRFPKSQKDMFDPKGIRSVQFDIAGLQPEAIYLHLDSRRLPRGTGILDFLQPEVLTDLSLSVRRRVTAEYNEVIGAVYIVERSTGVRGIPQHTKYQEMIERFPATADGLTIPFGISKNAKPVYYSFNSGYHLLVAGTTGGGKSNFLNMLLCTLIRRNTPDRLQLALIDLKGGLELAPYAGIPHLLKIEGLEEDGIATERDQVLGILNWIHAEGEKRMTKLKTAGYRDIGTYNNRNRSRAMSRIILFIDEWADMMLFDKTNKAQAEEVLANICSRFRAVGIHVILSTQHPKAEVLTTRIKGVLPMKLAFNCSTQTQSMVILDNASAKQLFPVGRAVLQFERGELELQTPYINDLIISQHIEGAKTGQYETTDSHDVTELEVMRFALENLNGYLSRDELFKTFGKRGITKIELSEWLKSWEGKNYIIGSSEFTVEISRGQKPRRLISTENQKAKSDD